MQIVTRSGATPYLNRDNFIHSIDSIFDQLWNQTFPEFGKTFGVDAFEKQSYPKIDAIDYSDRVEIEAGVPGLSKSDVNVEYTDGVLTISGIKQSNSEDGNKKNYIYRELKRSSFKRSFNVDPNILDVDNIKASFRDGILTLVLNKKTPETKPTKKINID